MNNHGDSRALRRIKNAANQRKWRQDPARREEQQVADIARRRIAREQPGRREEEQVANTARRRIAREEPGRREEEQVAGTAQRGIAREQPGTREEEQVADTARRRIAREQLGVQEHEARQLRTTRANKHVEMATKFVNGEHVFHQHCGTWSKECVHGCGYIHLSSSTAGTQKKCCANGRLS
jgi:hypothetical protein